MQFSGTARAPPRDGVLPGDGAGAWSKFAVRRCGVAGIAGTALAPACFVAKTQNGDATEQLPTIRRLPPGDWNASKISIVMVLTSPGGSTSTEYFRSAACRHILVMLHLFYIQHLLPPQGLGFYARMPFIRFGAYGEAVLSACGGQHETFGKIGFRIATVNHQWGVVYLGADAATAVNRDLALPATAAAAPHSASGNTLPLDPSTAHRTPGPAGTSVRPCRRPHGEDIVVGYR